MSWWGSELAGLLPGASRRSARGVDRRYLLSVEASGLSLLDQRSAAGLDPASRLTAAAPQRDVLIQLQDLVRSKKTSALSLRVPLSACFSRRLELPSAASADFAKLLALDFERVTPFKAKDVYLAHYVETTPASAGKVWVRQLVLKRNAIAAIKSEVESLGITVGHIDCWDETKLAALPINFLDSEANGKPEGRGKLNGYLLFAGLGLALAAAGTYLLVEKYETALSELQIQSDKQRVRSQLARDALAQSQASFGEIASIYKLRSENVARMAIIEELTTLFPDTAWVTDLKIDGDTIDVTGFAKSGAALIPPLERSALFVDATATAPLTFDQREDKDRFSIRVRIRKPSSGSLEPSAELRR